MGKYVQFESRKARVRYMDIVEFLSAKHAAEFRKAVHALYERKLDSEDGEFETFSITGRDLESILSDIKAVV